jgi:hypothetical protein
MSRFSPQRDKRWRTNSRANLAAVGTAAVGPGLGVGDLPALSDEGPPISAVGGEQRRRLTLLRVGVLAEEPSAHHYLLARNLAKRALLMMRGGSVEVKASGTEPRNELGVTCLS